MDKTVPNMSILCKLGSIMVHLQEFFSPTGHTNDMDAVKSLLDDAEINEWLKEMDRLSLLPKKR